MYISKCALALIYLRRFAAKVGGVENQVRDAEKTKQPADQIANCLG